jgi:undecaprenyl-diphosphatase
LRRIIVAPYSAGLNARLFALGCNLRSRCAVHRVKKRWLGCPTWSVQPLPGGLHEGSSANGRNIWLIKLNSTQDKIQSGFNQMTLLQILVLAIVQGAAELLPVSSSAHVIVAEKLMGLDPTTPAMTLLLVMLHTGTMFAVIVFFWSSWKASFFSSKEVFWDSAKFIVAATALTGLVGMSLKFLIEKFFMKDVPHAEIEQLFGNMNLISAALAAVGLLIVYAGIKNRASSGNGRALDFKESCYVGAIQGICLPFRGFSRSGATISAGLLLGIPRRKIEEFSFALAVVLTPPIIVREAMRLLQEQHAPLSSAADTAQVFVPSLLGMAFSFVAGLLALKWLSNWLESGRWPLFGLYCLVASVTVFVLHQNGI